MKIGSCFPIEKFHFGKLNLTQSIWKTSTKKGKRTVSSFRNSSFDINNLWYVLPVIAAWSDGAEQHAKSQKRHFVLQPSTKGGPTNQIIITITLHPEEHYYLVIQRSTILIIITTTKGGQPNYNGAAKVTFYQEQVPLSQGMFQLCENCEDPKYEENTIVKIKTKQEDKNKKEKSFSNWQINSQRKWIPSLEGPYTEGGNDQADYEWRGKFHFSHISFAVCLFLALSMSDEMFSSFSFCMFLLSHCQFQKWLSNLLDFFNPPSVYVKHVCFVNFTQWVAQQLLKLAFQLPTRLSFGSTASFSVSVSLPYYCWSKKQTSKKLLFLEPS